MDWTWIVPTIAVVAGATALVLALSRKLGHRLPWRHGSRVDMSETICVNCGYPLKGLDIPRCPECGALRGFTKPLDELGLTEEEIREGFARRKRERSRKEPRQKDQQ